MIDFSGIAKMGTFGIPAYEYYQFLSSMKWKLDDKMKIYELTKGFIEGYGETGFTPEADEFFKTHCF